MVGTERGLWEIVGMERGVMGNGRQGEEGYV